jgi:hypothetical protein
MDVVLLHIGAKDLLPVASHDDQRRVQALGAAVRIHRSSGTYLAWLLVAP